MKVTICFFLVCCELYTGNIGINIMDIPQSVPPEPTLPYPGVQNVQLEQAKSQTFNIKDLTPEVSSVEFIVN